MTEIFTKDITLNWKETGTIVVGGPSTMDDLNRLEAIVQGDGKMLSETISRAENVIVINT